MKKLFLLRHGKAGLLANDKSRPLAPRGKQDIFWLGQYLKKSRMLPDHIFCSGALRTRESFDQIKAGADVSLPVVFRDDLYLADAEYMTRLIQKFDPKISAAMIISHNPGLAQIFHNLSQDPSNNYHSLAFPTGTLAIIGFDIDDWSELKNDTGQVLQVIMPPEMRKNA
ncbi:MAG: histidine phosphatase family protein [Emcibacter sp.]|nr:histidine phosphatase family protein [Emcibacter sp.]